MPLIKPMSDLRNKTREISRLCHSTGEPVFITRDGEGDLVVMSLATWQREQARFSLYRLLDEAEDDVRAGDRGVGLSTLRKRLEACCSQCSPPVHRFPSFPVVQVESNQL